MKNKKLTYVLGLAVLAVWGIIIYRVFNAAGSGDDPIYAASDKGPKEPYNDYTVPKDTAHLQLNYRDPFGLAKFKDTAKMPTRKNTPKMITAAKPVLNWGFIKYSGYIRNRASKKLIALVSINGKNLLFSEGETKEQVRLVKNMRDSIRVSFNGQTTCISLKSAAL